MFKGSKSEEYWDGRSCGWVLVRSPEVGDFLALEDTWKGPGYGVSCWMKKMMFQGSDLRQVRHRVRPVKSNVSEVPNSKGQVLLCSNKKKNTVASGLDKWLYGFAQNP